jgi:hypothetical protein
MNSHFRVAFLTVSAAVAMPLLDVAPASAITVTVGSTNYEVNVFMGVYTGNESIFQLPPLGTMPWWGDDLLAATFAEQVYDQLGSGASEGYGPIFAYELSGSDILGISQNLTDPLNQITETISSVASANYAIATPQDSPQASVPAPLPLFGAAAAFGWSRTLRKRVADSKS